MKPALQLRLSQQLTMTPQLQQAIKLLQLSAQELELQLLEAVESNPLLEREDLVNEGGDEEELNREAERGNGAADNDRDSIAENEGLDRYAGDDGGWDRQFQDMPNAGGTSPRRESSGPDRPIDIPDRDDESNDLKQHLLWQLNLSRASSLDRAIGVTIIDAINEDGYLELSLEEIRQTLRPDFDADEDEILAVLHMIQRFDPLGVAAADVRDCLGIQLGMMANDLPGYELARRIIDHHLESLASQDVARLKRELRVDDEALKVAIDLVRSLDPRPGAQIPSHDIEYIRPDVVVKRVDGIWRVSLYDEFMPRLMINDFYAQMIGKAGKEDDSYLRGQLQEARWLIKSIETRNETLFKVASAIVRHQTEFFEKGPEHMKPLVLREIADTIEMHESTVSRVTSRKYMLTPRGVFEFKYFFSSHVGTADGEGASATAIQAMIKKLVDEENPAKPLSDNKIAQILNDRGIDVARRTVAKYREGINIAASSQRKRLI